MNTQIYCESVHPSSVQYISLPKIEILHSTVKEKTYEKSIFKSKHSRRLQVQAWEKQPAYVTEGFYLPAAESKICLGTTFRVIAIFEAKEETLKHNIRNPRSNHWLRRTTVNRWRSTQVNGRRAPSFVWYQPTQANHHVAAVAAQTYQS